MRNQVRDAKKKEVIAKFKNVDKFVEKLSKDKGSVKAAFLANLSNLLDDPNVFGNDGVKKVEMHQKIGQLLSEAFSQGDSFLTDDNSVAKQTLIDMIEDIKNWILILLK